MSNKKLIRKNFRDAVFHRDGNKCVFCDIREDLDAHHITDRNLMLNGGYVLENGITLCPKHHEMAEIFHQSEHREWREGFHPDALYQKIGSSREKANKASQALGKTPRIDPVEQAYQALLEDAKLSPEYQFITQDLKEGVEAQVVSCLQELLFQAFLCGSKAGKLDVQK